MSLSRSLSDSLNASNSSNVIQFPSRQPVSLDETKIRHIVEAAGAHFIGIQRCVEVLGEDLVLLTHRDLPNAMIGIRSSQIDPLEILLAVSAQLCRYRKSVSATYATPRRPLLIKNKKEIERRKASRPCILTWNFGLDCLIWILEKLVAGLQAVGL